MSVFVGMKGNTILCKLLITLELVVKRLNDTHYHRGLAHKISDPHTLHVYNNPPS